MKKDVKSKGRKKNITAGPGNVYKRGSSLNTGGPVGDKGGYSQRKADAKKRKAGSSFSSGNQPSNYKPKDSGAPNLFTSTQNSNSAPNHFAFFKNGKRRGMANKNNNPIEYLSRVKAVGQKP